MNYKEFDFSGVGVRNGNFLGFPYSIADAQIIIQPVAWDVTTSYGGGTAKGPSAIIDASVQLDVTDLDVPAAHKFGLAVGEDIKGIHELNKAFRPIAKTIIDSLEAGQKADEKQLEQINKASFDINTAVYNTCSNWLSNQKLVLLLGGDHSTPLGYLKALSKQHEEFGILQIDAHTDLRNAYEGFEFSHASIMHNSLKINQITSLTQVGIRDLSEKEFELTQSDTRIQCFFDQHLQEKVLNGESWQSVCDSIVSKLPEKVYVSFDIDGLKPELCPNTGTPVVGGLSYYQAIMLLNTVVNTGRCIIGADLVEVSPEENGEWNANVGARIAYKLANLMGKSQGLKALF
jgi:agmatinase